MYRIFTTVVTPAVPVSPRLQPYDLTDLATVKADIGITTSDADSWINSKITRVSQAIASHCRRVLVQETVKDLIMPARDSYPAQVPGGIPMLQLSRWPAASITSVTEQDGTGTPTTLTEGTDFLTDNKAGQLIRLDQYTNYPTCWSPINIAVTYVAGYATIPGDIVDAAIRLIRKDYWNRGSDPSIKREVEQGVEKEYWVATGNDGNFPPDIADLLAPYVVDVIA